MVKPDETKRHTVVPRVSDLTSRKSKQRARTVHASRLVRLFVCCDSTSSTRPNPGCRPLYRETIGMACDGILAERVACRWGSKDEEPGGDQAVA